MTIKLEHGKRYRIRDRRECTVFINPYYGEAKYGEEVATVFVQGLIKAETYSLDGKYWSGGENNIMDIVEEIL